MRDFLKIDIVGLSHIDFVPFLKNSTVLEILMVVCTPVWLGYLLQLELLLDYLMLR